MKSWYKTVTFERYRPAKPKGLFGYITCHAILSVQNTLSIYHQIHLTRMYSLHVKGGASPWLTQTLFQKPLVGLISSDEDADTFIFHNHEKSNCHHYRYIATSHSCWVLDRNALLALHRVCFVLFRDGRRRLKEENAMLSSNPFDIYL